MFSISGEGIALIKRFEGLRLEAYYDDVGVLTIGWGHTGSDVFEGQVITEPQAEDLLAKDLQRFESGVNGSVKVRITQSMFDALVSFSYNVGVGALKKSTALKRLNKGDYEGAAEALTWWNKGRVGGQLVVLRGLQIRRSAEAALFLRDLDQIEDQAAPALAGVEVKENPPRRNNPITTRTTGGAATSGAAGAGAAGAVLLDKDDNKKGENPQPSPGPEPEEPEENDELQTPSAGEPTPSEDSEAGEGQPNVGPDQGSEDEGDGTATEVPTNPQAGDPTEKDYTDAIVVAAGVLAVLAALYVIAARIDDWFKYRR
ncbi:MAG: lysozyme [Pseudomonadota bacterium]